MEPHPLTHMIKFRIRNRSRLAKFRYQKVYFLYRGLDSPIDSQIDHDQESVVLNIKMRTNNEYCHGQTKLTRQEMWILDDRVINSYDEYCNFKKESRVTLSELYSKMKDDDNRYYEEKIERIEYAIEKLKDSYEDYKSKYEIQKRIMNGTLQEYLDYLEDDF